MASSIATVRIRAPRAFSCACAQRPTQGPAKAAGVALSTLLASAALAVAPALAVGVDFAAPQQGSVTSPVHLEMRVDGLEVRPAADGFQPGTGHFHVLVDETKQFEEGEVIPFDDSHKHYGKGQLEADIDLTSGKHTLTLQFANALHQSYGPQLAKTIEVSVP